MSLPERTILSLISLGVSTIQADPGLLDPILGSLGAEEVAKAKTLFGTNPPRVVHGYPRSGAPLPCFALILSGDDILQDYVGEGFDVKLDTLDQRTGADFKRRIRGRFTIFVYAEHPDWCAWLYRILRRIVNLGARFLWAQRIYNPQITGTDMIPDPRFVPENVYVRKLTLSVEYEDEWNDTDQLWAAINGAVVAATNEQAEDFSISGELSIYHEDIIGGSVTPYSE